MPWWNVGIAGFADPRVWSIAPEWRDCPGVRLRAAADGHADRLTRARDELGILRLYSSWQELLAREDLHFLQIGLPPSERAHLLEEAAARGIHCLLQAPMAASLDQAERMLQAARASGIRLLVDWPVLRQPTALAAAEILSGGVYGVLQQATCCVTAPGAAPAPRAAEDASGGSAEPGPSPAGGGGADSSPERDGETRPQSNADANAEARRRLLDAALPGLHFFRLAVGIPRACSAVFETADPTDPEAPVEALQILLSYAVRATVTARFRGSGTDTQPHLIAECADGVLNLEGEHLDVKSGGSSGELTTPGEEEGGFGGPALLYRYVLQGREIEGAGNAQVARDTCEIVEASARSIEIGRPVNLPLR